MLILNKLKRILEVTKIDSVLSARKKITSCPEFLFSNTFHFSHIILYFFTEKVNCTINDGKEAGKGGPNLYSDYVYSPTGISVFSFFLQTDSIGEISNVGIYSKMFNFARQMRIYDITS